VFGGNDKEMLQDLVVAAVNEGIRKVDEALAGQLGNLAGGMKIPGMF
jgi:DNA-binding protein YbaB